jgi:hypothetical protein
MISPNPKTNRKPQPSSRNPRPLMSFLKARNMVARISKMKKNQMETKVETDLERNKANPKMDNLSYNLSIYGDFFMDDSRIFIYWWRIGVFI